MQNAHAAALWLLQMALEWYQVLGMSNVFILMCCCLHPHMPLSHLGTDSYVQANNLRRRYI